MRRLGITGVLAALLPGLAGCAQGIEPRGFQTRVIASSSVDDVFQAAQVVLRREFGPLEIDADMHHITSRPVEYRTALDSGTARDLYRGRSTMRRIAQFSAGPRGDDTVVRLRVDVEREDTTRREVFQPDRTRLTDAPSETPIQRDAATSAQQNTVWTFVKRDARLERALLAELQELFAPAPDNAESEPTAVDHAETAP